jgi:hypothetical protein
MLPKAWRMPHYLLFSARMNCAIRRPSAKQLWRLCRRRAKSSSSITGCRPVSPSRVAVRSACSITMVKILSAVLSDGLAAVEAACGEALADGRRAADRASECRRFSGSGLLRPRRRRAHPDGRQCRSRLFEPRPSGRGRGQARPGEGAVGHRRKDRPVPRHEHRGGCLGGLSDRRFEHDPRDQGGVERARP